MTKSGHLDIVLSNDSPDPKLVLLNDGKGNFTIGGEYGEPRTFQILFRSNEEDVLREIKAFIASLAQ